MGITITPSKSQVRAHQTFSSGTGVSYNFDAGGGGQIRAASSAKAKLKVSFTGGQGVSINAYGIQYTQIQNYQSVTNAVLALYNSGKWSKHWVIVTDLYQAQKCLMAISNEGSQEAEIEFEAQHKLPTATATLANANLGLVCKSQRNIGYTLDTLKGKVTLGFGLGAISASFIRRPRFQPFENKGRWGNDGPTTMNFEMRRTPNVHIPDMIETGPPRFVRVQVSV
ncbi:hypothetical protein [Hymenobacter fodinae]|nr:hypothetical protein [Hymenobacter fodinae]